MQLIDWEKIVEAVMEGCVPTRAEKVIIDYCSQLVNENISTDKLFEEIDNIIGISRLFGGYVAHQKFKER